MIRRVALLLAVGLCPLLSGCAEEAEPCGISDNGNGTSTLTCNGERIVIPGGTSASDCTMVRGEDGGAVITCADGTVIRLDADGRPIFPGKGTIQGVAHLYGQVDHAGIEVRAVGTPYSTTTDSKGQYQLAGLPAGLYALSFEGRGRVPERIENIPALDGIFVAPPVELRLGMQIAKEFVSVEESPRHDTFFPLVGGGSDRLTVWDVGSRIGTVLSATASSPSYSDDGGRLVFIEDRSLNGKVVVWDVDERRAEQLYEGAISAMFLPGGDTVQVFHDDGLALVDVASKEAVELPDSRSAGILKASPDGKTLVYQLSDERVAIWDVKAKRLAAELPDLLLGDAQFTPDGRDVVIVGSGVAGSQRILRWDVAAAEATAWETSDVGGIFLQQVTDRFALYWVQDGFASSSTRLWSRGDDEPRDLGPTSFVAPVLNDTFVLWQPDGVAPNLWLVDAATGDQTILATNVLRVEPSLDGHAVAVQANAGEWELISLPGKKRTSLDPCDFLQWQGGWLEVHSGGRFRLYRGSTGRLVEVPENGAQWRFSSSGSRLFFTLPPGAPEDDFRFLGFLDLERDETKMLGKVGSFSTFEPSLSGRTVFSTESGGGGQALWRIDTATGGRDLIDAAVSLAAVRERFALYFKSVDGDNGTWLVTSFD